MPNHRRGFTLVELMVVSALMAVLAVLLSSAWVGVGRTAAGLVGRSQLVQERDLAVVALSRDLGGCWVEPDARKGEKIGGRWLKWEYPNNDVLPSNQDLTLYYDGGTNPTTGNTLDDTVVHYLVAPDPDPEVSTLILVRRITVNGGTPTDFTVARNVHSMTVMPDGTPVRAVEIVLCFKYRKLTLTCDLTAKQPSVPSNQTLPWSIDHYTNP
jgi:prepilin-type N-terminal cleavage/methylation domain-containing protein